MLLLALLVKVVLSLLHGQHEVMGQDPHQTLPSRIQEQYERLFTFKLGLVFHAPQTLNEASRQTQVNSAIPIYSEKSLGFGCACYKDGADIGK